MAESSSFSDVRARLAALRGASAPRGHGAPGGPTPDQLDAIQETMEILSDHEMLMRVRAGRRAVAAADVVGLEEPSGEPGQTASPWRVALTGPVARELAEMAQPSASALGEMLAALARSPAEEGRALGLGLAGVWSARRASHRILFAVDEDHRLVTVLSVDGH